MNSEIVDQSKSLEELMRSKKISKETFGRVKVAQNYIEKKYMIKKQEETNRKDDWEIIFKKMTEYKLSEKEQNQIKKEILHKETMQKRRL